VITLLTPEDIEFMKETRQEVVSNRQSSITLIYEDGGAVDPITDEVTDPTEVPFSTLGVVTEISSQVKYDRYLANGIEVQKGDIWFSVTIEGLADIYEKLTEVVYGGKRYEILSKDKKGIGERNRAEFVGRLLT
jgi:hypothetical protein